MRRITRNNLARVGVCLLTGLAAVSVLSPASAAQLVVRAGGNFQQALNNAKPGDTIVLEAGATFTGPFTLPNKSGPSKNAKWIVIQSSALSALPTAGQRVGPQHAGAMPKVVAPGQGLPALTTAEAAHHYRLVGIEFAKATSSAHVNDLILLGDGTAAQNTLEKVPHNLVLDRCYIHGPEDSASAHLKRGIALNSAHTEIVGCYIAEVKLKGQESQAICGWNGPGPFKIVNNFVQGSGINIMFGGADPRIPNLVPADIEIRKNTIPKPVRWRGNFSVKNLLELKNARRVRIEGNVMEWNWRDAQSGYAILFKSVNQEGSAPWCVVENVVFTNNIVRHSAAAVNMLGRDGTTWNTRFVDIVNNLFEDINGETWGNTDPDTGQWIPGDGCFLQISECDNVRVEHNTVFQTGNITKAYGVVCRNFIFRNNIVPRGAYGVFGDGASEGTVTLNTYFPGYTFPRNVIPEANASVYPANNFFPATLHDVGFVDLAGGNYRLAASSPYLRQATDGTDPGCNFDQLNAAMQ